MSFKFIPSLCNDEKTSKLCRNVLRNASFKLRDVMLEGVSTDIKTNLVRSLKENSTADEFNLISHFVANRINKLSHETKKRHQRKYERDHIRTLESKCKNRRFRISKRKKHDRGRKKDWLERRRVTISTAKLNGPDQNAINLTNIELSDTCKYLLSKGPSFVLTHYDINWYNLRKNFDNFVNKLRFLTPLTKIPLQERLLKQPIFVLKQLTLIV